MKNPTYKPCPDCGAECHMDDEDEPCWGPAANLIDEITTEDDHYMIHACQGHARTYDEGIYTPEQK